MGYQLTEDELHICWALTGMFGGGDEIFYNYIAAQINSYPIEEIERLFFDCVAPVYHSYIFKPISFGVYKKEDVREFINDYLLRPKCIFFHSNISIQKYSVGYSMNNGRY